MPYPDASPEKNLYNHDLICLFISRIIRNERFEGEFESSSKGMSKDTDPLLDGRGTSLRDADFLPFSKASKLCIGRNDSSEISVGGLVSSPSSIRLRGSVRRRSEGDIIFHKRGVNGRFA